MLSIDDITIGEAKRISALIKCMGEDNTQPCGVGTSVSSYGVFSVGTAYLIRTPMFHYIGVVRSVTDKFLVLDTAGWMADTGRFSECIENGTYKEYEYMGNGVIVVQSNICDAIAWKHAVPTTSK